MGFVGHDEPAERSTHVTVPDLAYRSRLRRRIPGRHRFIQLKTGELIPANRATADVLAPCRRDDAHDIRSFGSGCAPEQVDEFNALFGHLGVKYDPQTGDAIYDDRPAKLRVLRERGYVDNDEIRGGANIPR